MAMKEPVVVLANAGSGKQDAERIEHLLAPLRAAGIAPQVQLIRRGRDIPGAARRARDGFATVIAAGGDGTICGVANELVGSDVAMGILPLGTFNFFARSLGLPETAEEAAAALIGATERRVAVGEVNGRVFLNNASLGLYPALLEQREAAYARWGRSRLAAYWSALHTLATYDRPSRLRITFDGEARHLRSPMVYIAQNAYQLQQYGMQDGVDLLEQGQLAVYIAPELRRMQLLGFALRMAFRQARPYRDFTLVGARDLLIETRSPRRTIARDGEREKMAAPFQFHWRADALLVLAPPVAGDDQPQQGG